MSLVMQKVYCLKEALIQQFLIVMKKRGLTPESELSANESVRFNLPSKEGETKQYPEKGNEKCVQRKSILVNRGNKRKFEDEVEPVTKKLTAKERRRHQRREKTKKVVHFYRTTNVKNRNKVLNYVLY